MKGVPGGDFDQAWATRQTFVCGTTAIMFVDRAELIRLKRASGRAQDLVDVATLLGDTSDDA